MPSVVVLVLRDMTRFDELLAAWRAAGAPNATVLDSAGMEQLEAMRKRDDLPLIPTLRDLLRSEEEPSKTVFSVVDDDRVGPLIEATERVLGDLDQPDRGIIFAIPATQVRGYRSI